MEHGIRLSRRIDSRHAITTPNSTCNSSTSNSLPRFLMPSAQGSATPSTDQGSRQFGPPSSSSGRTPPVLTVSHVDVDVHRSPKSACDYLTSASLPKSSQTSTSSLVIPEIRSKLGELSSTKFTLTESSSTNTAQPASPRSRGSSDGESMSRQSKESAADGHGRPDRTASRPTWELKALHDYRGPIYQV